MKSKLLLLALLLGLTVQAQDGYQFTLIQNSTYNYSVQAVANYASNVAIDPDLESFSFTIMLQDGASIDESTLVLPYGTLDGGAITVNSAVILDSFDPGHDRSSNRVAISSGSNLGFPGHLMGDQITIATFDILGFPNMGEISILDNGSSLAMAAGSTLDSFINTDTSGGNNAVNTYYGQTGTTAYSFSTLSTLDIDLNAFSIFPNPATDVVNIRGLENHLISIEVFNVAGQKVLTSVSNLESINVRELEAGVYLVQLNTETASKTIKLIKKK